jgi:hypothetical protein
MTRDKNHANCFAAPEISPLSKGVPVNRHLKAYDIIKRFTIPKKFCFF